MALKMVMTTKALGETIFPYLTTVEGLKPPPRSSTRTWPYLVAAQIRRRNDQP